MNSIVCHRTEVTPSGVIRLSTDELYCVIVRPHKV